MDKRAGLIATLAGVLLPAALVLRAVDEAPDPNQPTTVTLHHHQEPASRVLDDLFKQMGVPYSVPAQLAERPITIEATNEPFWQVATRINDALSTSMSIRADRVTFYAHATDDMGLPLSSGPCLLTARAVSHRAKLTDAAHLDDCGIRVAILAEPKLRLVQYSGRIAPDMAVDEQGNSLMPGEIPYDLVNAPNSADVPWAKVRPDTIMESEIVLRVPTKAGRTIAQVKGKLHVRALGKKTVIEVPAVEFGAAHSYTFHGAGISISAITNMRQPPDNEYRVAVTFTRTADSTDQWSNINDLLDGAALAILDDKGAAWNNPGWGTGGGRTSPTRSMSAQFTPASPVPTTPRPGAPALFRLTIPDELIDIALPYEFKNLPLP